MMISELQNIHLTQDNDKWSYIWGSPIFASSKAYSHLLGSIPVPPTFKWLWNSSCLPKRKVFFWLLLHDRLSTREILRRRNMELPSYNCVLCHLNAEESLHHLFLDCPYAMSFWNMLGLAHLIQMDIFDTLNQFRGQIQTLCIAMFWAIWSVRNDAISRNQQHSLQTCKVIFKQELARVKLRAKSDLRLHLQLWLDNFV